MYTLNVWQFCQLISQFKKKTEMWKYVHKKLSEQRSRKINCNLRQQRDDLVVWWSRCWEACSCFSTALTLIPPGDIPTLLLYVFSFWLCFIFPHRFLIISCSGMLIRHTLNFPRMTFKMISWWVSQDLSANLNCDSWLQTLVLRTKMITQSTLFVPAWKKN